MTRTLPHSLVSGFLQAALWLSRVRRVTMAAAWLGIGLGIGSGLGLGLGLGLELGLWLGFHALLVAVLLLRELKQLLLCELVRVRVRVKVVTRSKVSVA